MKRKRTIILALQLLLVVVTAWSFVNYVQKEVQPVTAYVFARDMDANTQITEADIRAVTVPAKALSNEFALKKEDIVGKYAASKVYANTFVYKKQLAEEGEVDPFESMDLSKYRKISLPISYVDGFGGNIKRGDRVDLIFTGSGTKKGEDGTEQRFEYAKVFLQDVLVYNVTTGEGLPYIDKTENYEQTQSSGEKIDTTANSGDLAVVTLAVTLDQAEEIAARLNAGQIRLVARFDEHQSYETLGFVLGEYSKIFTAPANVETGRATINQ